jgi:glycosyltransferase involved in cell wall biosynthesis
LTTLIEAAAKAGVCVQLAGDGPQRDALQALAETLRADVQFLGRLEGDALHAAVRSSRATVLPAVWYENAPISVLESYALAKPVIGADIGGLPELIGQDHTGALVPSGCSDTLAATLRRFAELPDARIAEMGRAGRALVETRYSPASYFNAVEGLYDDLVRTG